MSADRSHTDVVDGAQTRRARAPLFGPLTDPHRQPCSTENDVNACALLRCVSVKHNAFTEAGRTARGMSLVGSEQIGISGPLFLLV
jgi:hypothetical protein